MSVGWYLFGDNILSWRFSNYTVELVAILLLSEARLGLVFRKKNIANIYEPWKSEELQEVFGKA